ncbi:tat pathway signal sequence [Penicillium taxi]|uniref:tat pathway signal sequence n=1 Tax=Penicillium taxi TaxID=168475 RepID=UPI0025450605|nr:tat pathway signal sequence [Penicillium taxi]KAJ5901436.1 tat pathway signal sequence [Penicillium taxi]
MPDIQALAMNLLKASPARYSSDSEANEENEQFLPHVPGVEQWPKVPKPRTALSRACWIATVLNLLLFLVSVYILFDSHHLLQDLRQNKNNKLMNTAPFLDQINIPLRDVKVNGSLLDMDDSIFRAPPSPEVDRAWNRIGSLTPHVMNGDDVVRLGKDPTKTARFTEDFGFGPDAHIAELDVLHTIHCLNAIRRDVHWRHYYIEKYPTGEFPELHRIHTDHCLYVVLQNLMCSATLDVVTQPWVHGQLHPFPDFSINKKCRDFGAILEWHEKTTVGDLEAYSALRMPEGHVPYEMSEEFYRAFGVADGEDEHHH